MKIKKMDIMAAEVNLAMGQRASQNELQLGMKRKMNLLVDSLRKCEV